jgi:hypothetical protein
MSFEVTGKLHAKYDTQQVSERFRKREFVLELAEEINGNVYTNYAKMQLVQNKCELLDRFNEGESLKVNFNIKGNRWEKDGKVNFITNLDAWRVEAATASSNAPQGAGGNYGNAAPSGNANSGESGNPGGFYNPSPENVDDLPF